MPRKHLERNAHLPYHVTARANNKEQFPLPLEKFWSILGIEGLQISIHGAQIHSLVLMPNHIHMILSVPEQDLGKVMNTFMRSISRVSHLHSGRSGHLFGGPYYWSLIRETRYFRHVLKYVYRNPVKARLCERVESYPYSTLHGLLGNLISRFRSIRQGSAWSSRCRHSSLANNSTGLIARFQAKPRVSSKGPYESGH